MPWCRAAGWGTAQRSFPSRMGRPKEVNRITFISDGFCSSLSLRPRKASVHPVLPYGLRSQFQTMTMSDTQLVEGEVKVSIFEKIRRFYRGTFFQAILLGLVSFTQPGIWVGLNSTFQLFPLVCGFVWSATLLYRFKFLTSDIEKF